MFFEASTRTQASFEIAGQRLGADVMNMAMQASSVKKGETLIGQARMTLRERQQHPDLLVVRTRPAIRGGNLPAPDKPTARSCLKASGEHRPDTVHHTTRAWLRNDG